MNRTEYKNFEEANSAYMALEARADVEFCDICRNKVTKDWIVRFELVAVLPMKEQVYNELLRCQEGGGSVYLDNVDFAGLGINRHQFAGYLSALAADGRYKETGDSHFGRLVGVE